MLDEASSLAVAEAARDARLPFVFFFKQKTAYEILRSDWSSDVCSSDLGAVRVGLNIAPEWNPPGVEMKLEPPRSEDLRILWIRHAAKARWTALLIALGLVIGFAVGARLGAISQRPSVQTVSRVDDRVDAADTSDSPDSSAPSAPSAPSEAARVETAGASGEAPAGVAIASAPDEPTAPIPASPSSGAESEATPGQEPSPEPDREQEEESQGRVVARYASVSIY